MLFADEFAVEFEVEGLWVAFFFPPEDAALFDDGDLVGHFVAHLTRV